MKRPEKMIQLGEYDQRFEVLDEDLLWQAYEGDNFRIIETPRKQKEKIAAIYFSSNGLYDVKQAKFNREILEKDRYEWMRNQIAIADKHIFVRDIFQMSYYHGINTQTDSMEKLIKFLEQQTVGYKVVCLGSSGGGYAAALAGSVLGAEYVFSFSGQFDVIGFSYACSGEAPRLWNQEAGKDKYLQIEEFVKKGKTPIYYFVGANNLYDRGDLAIAERLKNVRVVKLNNDKHGMPADKHYLRELINLPQEKLEKFALRFGGRKVNNSQIGWAVKGWKHIPAMAANFGKAIERKLRKLRKKLLHK